MTNTTTALKNTGHGHVVPRADGVKVRCGGPGLCPVCNHERAALAAPAPALDAPAVLPSEAVIGFAGWLTCRDESVTFGSTEDASPAAVLTGQYWQAQGWDAPREDFASRLKRMPTTARASQPTPAQDAWHAAVLEQCMSAHGAYFPADPAKTLRLLLDWHVVNARGTAQDAAAAVPEGWKLVPVEPTAQMCKAAADAWLDCGSKMVLNKAGAAVRAGIKAAPQAAPTAAQPAPVKGTVEYAFQPLTAPATPQAPALVPLTDHHKLDNDQQVFFYEQDFYVLSNFSAFNLKFNGLTFPTSEHAYHYEKFAYERVGESVNDAFQRRNLAMSIKEAPSAHEAFKLAERWKGYRRADWDAVKVDIMREILRAKASQHEYVRRKLLETGDRELIEDSWRDDYWGWGPNRDGQNMLGKLWMEVRAGLRGITPAGTTPKEQQ